MKDFKHFWNRAMFLQRNKILYWLSLILIVMFLIIIHDCSLPLVLPEKYFGWLISAPDGDKTLYNIAISYVAAYIFYIIQVYIPEKQSEERAYRAIQTALSGIVRSIKEVLYLIDNMYEIDEKGIIMDANSDWFYYCEYEDRNVMDEDLVHKREIRNGKVVHKMHRNCIRKKGLYDICENLKKNYDSLKNREEMQKLDVNTEEMIRKLEATKFCESFFSSLNLMEHLDEVKATVDSYNVEEAAKALNAKNVPGVQFKSRGNIVVGCTNAGEEYVVLKSQIPFSTGVNKVIVGMKERIERLEYILDVDGNIIFRENTPDEERKQRDNERLSKSIQKIFQ